MTKQMNAGRYGLIFLFFLLFPILFISCNNQLTRLEKSASMLAVSTLNPSDKSSLGEKSTANGHEPANEIKSEKPVIILKASHNNLKPVFNRSTTSLNPLQFIKKQGLPLLNTLKLSAGRHTAASAGGRINKAGFILIAAGILALVVKLIAIAGIILIVLGVIILFAPLLRKRPY